MALPNPRTVTSIILCIAICLASATAGARQSFDAPSPPGRLIDVGGRRLHLNCTGAGTPTVVIESGSGAFSVDWALVQPAVSKFTRICTYDRAGYAWSDPGPIRDLPEQSIADFELMLRLAPIRPPYVLVGQSIGGILVRDYQRRLAEHVTGMVLVDPTHDEGLAYIIDGRPKTISLLTRDELQQFMRDFLVRPATAPRISQQISAPFDRLPAALQPIRLWAETQYAADRDVNRTPYIGEAQRQEFIALRTQRRLQKHPLAKLPLVVLTNGVNEQKAELASLSESGTLVIAANSCHEIHLCSPELVTEAIRRVVDLGRRRR